MKSKLTILIAFITTFIPGAIAQTDGCAGATLITVNSTGCVTTNYSFASSFTDAFADPSCGASDRDAWFRFVATSSYTTINVTSNNSSGGDIVLSVYSACGASSQIGCVNGSGNAGLFGGSANEALNVPTTIGNTYFIRISRVSGCSFIGSLLGCSNTTSGTICLMQSAAPSNNQNCLSAVTLCSNASLSSASPGFGTQELATNPPQGCLTSGEHQSSWYAFSPQSTGSIQFSITPLTPIDYDFAIWGPFTTMNCSSLGSPIRCSYAAPGSGINPTGLNGTSSDLTEDAGGDGWVQQINIGASQVGKIYMMCIDNWSNNGIPFTFNWNLTGVSLDCTIPLPVELVNFNGVEKPYYNLLGWSTTSEVNSDYFLVEKSSNAIDWEEVGRTTAAGNSNIVKDYELKDPNPFSITYYRLSEYDLNGDFKTFNPISISRTSGSLTSGSLFSFYPNPASTKITVSTINQDANQLVITDHAGRIIYDMEITGKTILDIDLPILQAGVYFIRMVNKGVVQNEKLIISK